MGSGRRAMIGIEIAVAEDGPRLGSATSSQIVAERKIPEIPPEEKSVAMLPAISSP